MLSNVIFYLAYAVSVFVSLFFLVCLFLCYDMGVSPAINTNNNNNCNNRRSRQVFFCFYSAIFQLTSAKFQTFAYTVTQERFDLATWIFDSSFEFYVCTKFLGNRSRDFGFRTRKPPRKFDVKSGLSQKRLYVYFIGLHVLRYPFIPYINANIHKWHMLHAHSF